MTNMPTKCGFVAILGEPNAGKSTLVNQMTGNKVSIVSHKVQTTRQRILGLMIDDNVQLVLMDTPGIFEPTKRLDRAMVGAAWQAGHEADQVVLMVDVCKKNYNGPDAILEQLVNCPVILVLNKIDLVSKEKLLETATHFAKYSHIQHTFMISAFQNDGVKDLTKFLIDRMPEGPWLYPEDQITDLPQRLWAAEITREQLFIQLHQELPYDCLVETENWENFENGSIKVSQVIYVAREGQRPIVLGKGGRQIRAIGERARHEIEAQLETTVHLFLRVKVVEKWHEKAFAYRLMNLEFQK